MSAESKTYQRRRNLEGHAELKRQAEATYCGVGQQLNALKSLDSNNINAALARIQLERPELEEESRAEEDAVLQRLAKGETIIPTPAAEVGQFLEDLTTALELAQNSSLPDVADWRFAVVAQGRKFADLAESLGVDPTPFQSNNPIQQRRAVLERVQRKHQIQLREPKTPAGGKSKGIPIEEANIRAREYLKTHPNATARDLATSIGIALGTVSKLTAWKAVMGERRKGRTPKAPTAVRLIKNVEDNIPDKQVERDIELERLIEESNADNASDPSPVSLMARKRTPGVFPKL